MTITISISKFREDMAGYITRVRAGDRIALKDAKKGEVVAEVVGKKSFDPAAFRRVLRRTAGTFTAKNHPEWRTKRQVIAWVERGRAAADRTF